MLSSRSPCHPYHDNEPQSERQNAEKGTVIYVAHLEPKQQEQSTEERDCSRYRAVGWAHRNRGTSCRCGICDPRRGWSVCGTRCCLVQVCRSLRASTCELDGRCWYQLRHGVCYLALGDDDLGGGRSTFGGRLSLHQLRSCIARLGDCAGRDYCYC